MLVNAETWPRGAVSNWFFEILIMSFGLWYIYLIFSRQKPGVQFRHSRRDASENLAKSGERIVLTLGFLCLPYCMRYTAWSRFFFYFFCFILYPANGGLGKEDLVLRHLFRSELLILTPCFILLLKRGNKNNLFLQMGIKLTTTYRRRSYRWIIFLYNICGDQ